MMNSSTKPILLSDESKEKFYDEISNKFAHEFSITNEDHNILVVEFKKFSKEKVI